MTMAALEAAALRASLAHGDQDLAQRFFRAAAEHDPVLIATRGHAGSRSA